MAHQFHGIILQGPNVTQKVGHPWTDCNCRDETVMNFAPREHFTMDYGAKKSEVFCLPKNN